MTEQTIELQDAKDRVARFMKKVVVRELGIPHYLAKCDECEWTYGDYRDRRKGQRKIREHVSGTGHTVQLEKGVVTQYIFEDVK